MPRRLAAALALVAALVSSPSGARADEEPRPPDREVPDYDGRAPRPDDADDVLIWIPRILTGPLFLFSEYVVREPLGALATLAEREGWVQFFQRLFTFGPNRNIGIFPTAFYDFGFLPSVGLYAYWNDFLTPGNRISVHGSTWGLEWLSLSARDTVQIGHFAVSVRGAYLRRPDFVLDAATYLGGPSALVRYFGESFNGDIGYGLAPGHDRSSFGASLGMRWAAFRESRGVGEPSLGDYAMQRGVPAPVGFPEGYVVLALRLGGAIDTRDRSGVPSAGVRAYARGELDRSVVYPTTATWFSVAGELLGATDFLGGRRVLSLALDASAILAPDYTILPFDLTLDGGGQGPMPGFWPGQLRGMSIAALTLAYEWPVWLLLNARLFVATGNAFGPRFEGFGLSHLRLSFGFALRPTDAGPTPFELGIAAGTDPFDLGTTLTTFRFYVGVRNSL